MTAQVRNFVLTDPAVGVNFNAVHFVTGNEAILRLSRKLREFSVACGQPDAMQDLAYFLSKPGAMPRVPHLLLVGTPDLYLGNPNFRDVLGVLLIFEQCVSGVGMRAFATNDRAGRSTLVARPSDRSRVAALASRALLRRGAQVILMSYRTIEGNGCAATIQSLLPEASSDGRSLARWAMRERTIPGYLPLSMTYDATLALMGSRTRRNLRYYRRRAESELGCVFVPQVEATREEVLKFGRECMYPVPPEVVGFRYDSLRDLAEPAFMGVKDRDGRWLSMLGGRRYLNRSEILWQLNRDGLAAYSLGTVMRSYFIEHEVAKGSRRLYTEGGTPHSMKFSYVPEDLTDLVVIRRTLVAKAMQTLAKRYISPDNELSHMLWTNGLDWLPC